MNKRLRTKQRWGGAGMNTASCQVVCPSITDRLEKSWWLFARPSLFPISSMLPFKRFWKPKLPARSGLKLFWGLKVPKRPGIHGHHSTSRYTDVLRFHSSIQGALRGKVKKGDLGRKSRQLYVDHLAYFGDTWFNVSKSKLRSCLHYELQE